MFPVIKTKKYLNQVLNILNNKWEVVEMKITNLVLSAVSFVVSSALLTLSIINILKRDY